MNLREQFEKETGNKLINCNTEDAVLKYWIDYSKWLEQRNKEQVEVFRDLLEELKNEKLPPDAWVYFSKAEEQLKKSGEL